MCAERYIFPHRLCFARRDLNIKHICRHTKLYGKGKKSCVKKFSQRFWWILSAEFINMRKQIFSRHKHARFQTSRVFFKNTTMRMASWKFINESLGDCWDRLCKIHWDASFALDGALEIFMTPLSDVIFVRLGIEVFNEICRIILIIQSHKVSTSKFQFRTHIDGRREIKKSKMKLWRESFSELPENQIKFSIVQNPCNYSPLTAQLKA